MGGPPGWTGDTVAPGGTTGRIWTPSRWKNRPCVTHGLAAPEQPEHLDALVGPRPALGQRDPERVELLAELTPDADPDRDPPAGAGVEVEQLLGHHDRVVQGEQQDGGADPDPLGPGRHEGEPGDGLAARSGREEVPALPHRFDG